MPHQILSNQVYATTEVDIWRQPLSDFELVTESRRHCTESILCVSSVVQQYTLAKSENHHINVNDLGS